MMTLEHPQFTPRPDVGRNALWVFQGNYQVSTRRDVFFTSVLGSCIAVCMRDPAVGIGGMNHFLLPDSNGSEKNDPLLALRYGSYSIERLINAILSRGGLRERLEIKVFGGANVIASANQIGDRNAAFVERYFERERLRIVAADLRGGRARKIRYYPDSGRAQVSELREADGRETAVNEKAIMTRIAASPVSGGIDIF